MERFIANFMYQVPVPPMGVTRVQYSIGGESLILQRPAPNELPFTNVDFRLLFRCLDHTNILMVLSGLCLELSQACAERWICQRWRRSARSYSHRGD